MLFFLFGSVLGLNFFIFRDDALFFLMADDVIVDLEMVYVDFEMVCVDFEMVCGWLWL